MPKHKKSRKKSKLSVFFMKTYKFIHNSYHMTLDFLGRDLI